MTHFFMVCQIWAVQNPPFIERVCRDRSTGLVTIYFRPVLDACGSFQKYRLYGREDLLQSFVLMEESIVLNSNKFEVTPPNNKRWQFYITVLHACNRIDSFNSDSIRIDDIPPGYVEPDSVSVELTTQRLVVGWKESTDPDVMGYSLFKVDNATGNNFLVLDTTSLFYRFNTAQFDPTQSGNRVAIAAFDSCLNGGVISFDHSPILLLSGNTQICDSTHSLLWSSYKGWPVERYEIYYKQMGDLGFTYSGSATGTSNSYTLKLPNLDANYEFFIRAFKQNNDSVSSSSNKIQKYISGIEYPNYAEISRVSVIDEGLLEVVYSYEPISEISLVRIEFRKQGESSWNTLSSHLPNTNGKHRILHDWPNTSTERLEYRLILKNSCGDDYYVTENSTHVLLEKNLVLPSGNIIWNHYYSWPGSIIEYQIWVNPPGSFTWNVSATTSDTETLIMDTLVCIKIAAIRRTPATNTPIDTSFSNILCFKTDFETYIPNVFKPGSRLNGVFRVVNGGAKPGQIEMNIYDRWGGKIFQGDGLTGWDGKDVNGNEVPGGVYVYQIQVKVKAPYKFFNGTFYLLK